ncbi:hypothetical protein BDL97_05G088700 [Sphagnum fallax]|nr:hypothetical protein BDL97_05G088700 [Sphagnum fallax]
MVRNGAPLPDAVVVSSAVVAGNEEVDVARALGVPVYKRGAWLGKMTEGYKLLAVAGSHGKSTTVAMLAVALCSLGEDITVILGAQVPQEAVRDMFRKFVMRIKPGGLLLVNGDSAGSSSLGEVFQPKETHMACPDAKNVHVEMFGLGRANNWRAVDLVPNAEGGTDYIVVHAGIPMAQVSLRLPGTYNVLNSLAVIVAISMLAVEKQPASNYDQRLTIMRMAASAASKALGSFTGARRRFELIGKVQGCYIIDDYAHHPTEVRAVLQGARQRFRQQPIWVIFQPHTFSRLEKLLPDFALAFHAADRVIVTEVYTARNSIFDWNEGVVELLALELGAIDQNIVNTQGDVILLTLGAGDITNLGPQLMELLSPGPS